MQSIVVPFNFFKILITRNESFPKTNQSTMGLINVTTGKTSLVSYIVKSFTSVNYIHVYTRLRRFDDEEVKNE